VIGERYHAFFQIILFFRSQPCAVIIKPSSELKRKYFLGLRWLGEATKPDTIESRFVKLFFALEGLIGGEIKNSRETKIVLAKRCASLIATDTKDKERIYNKLLRYYKIRSEIVHGTGKDILEDDFSNLGQIVRKATWSLLELIDRFENINELDSWLMSTVAATNNKSIYSSLKRLWKKIKVLLSSKIRS